MSHPLTPHKVRPRDDRKTLVDELFPPCILPPSFTICQGQDLVENATRSTSATAVTRSPILKQPRISHHEPMMLPSPLTSNAKLNTFTHTHTQMINSGRKCVVMLDWITRHQRQVGAFGELLLTLLGMSCSRIVYVVVGLAVLVILHRS